MRGGRPTQLQPFLAPRVALLFSVLLATHAAAEPATSPDASIPREGLALWISGESAVVENGEVTTIKDRSGKANDAVRQKDPKIVAGNPALVKHEEAGVPVLRFNGQFCGYEFNSIADIRTAFLVVSKHPDAFKKFAERFVLGGKTKPEVDFHVGYHWTDVITENWKAKEHGKAWFNGLECDPSISEFSRKLAIISSVSKNSRLAGQLARDRDFKDRSWHGDIAEILLYTTPLSDEDRQKVEAYLTKKYAITPAPPVVVPRETVLPGHTQPPAGEAEKKGK
jgi:hypothetical protein